MNRLITKLLGRDQIQRLKQASTKERVETRLKKASLLSSGETITAYTAVRALGTQARLKLATHKKILCGIDDLREALEDKPAKTASFLAEARVLSTIYTSMDTGTKLADTTTNFSRVKTALFGSLSLPEVAKAAKSVFSTPVGKGLAMGAGAAVPMGLVANHVLNKQTDRVQHKLEKGLAIGAGVLATAYGAHKLLSGGPRSTGGSQKLSMFSPLGIATAHAAKVKKEDRTKKDNRQLAKGVATGVAALGTARGAHKLLSNKTSAVQKLSSHLLLDAILDTKEASAAIGKNSVAAVREKNASDGMRIMREMFSA